MESVFTARFDAGEEVRVIRTVRNDGSFPGMEKGEVLIEAGCVGIVRTYGFFLQTQVIYQVFFPEVNQVIGIRDEELIAARLDWVPRYFHSLDKAKLTRTLAMNGEVLAEKGQIVEIQRAYRDLEDGTLKYEITLSDLRFQLDASVFAQLTPAAVSQEQQG
ncbi:NifZ domain protein [Vibrio aerogenes CECT 7868]|uniref:NifZ domain protein n=1 Tax=Vibrio aerogenes CECT 7868 TaxID=1216006 RepID=A0A1M5WXU6_9VIBR|nr:nitrogen fixation protein NifZ [Vibrio aerogenes]SHH92535.1 NifZ domain protein [Vibrio aerogenes CECT 7868]